LKNARNCEKKDKKVVEKIKAEMKVGANGQIR